MNNPGSGGDARPIDTKAVIDKLLAERQEMLVLFCRVAGVSSYSEEKPVADLLEAFCEVLVDYSAFVHFELYEQIISGMEQPAEVVQVARELYPRILEASEVAVEFNDRYDATDHPVSLNSLDKDLSILGEELAIRVEMEDRMIKALLDS